MLAAGDQADTGIAGLVLTAGTAIFEPALGIAKVAERRPVPAGARLTVGVSRVCRLVVTRLVGRRWRASRGVGRRGRWLR
jgi:hypothetical protein